MSTVLDKLVFPKLPTLHGSVRPVFFEPLTGSGERYCIAFVGQTIDGEPISGTAVSHRVARRVIGELGANLVGFSQMVVQDYMVSTRKGVTPSEWHPPFQRMFLGEPRDLSGDSAEDLLRGASLLFAFLAQEQADQTSEVEPAVPAADEENEFRDRVRVAVEMARPGLREYFGRAYSLVGGSVRNRVDYMSSSYGVCFSALNPLTPKGRLLDRAQTALWRLARARDAVELTPPEVLEIVLWTPPAGLPIYKEQHYGLVSETVEELKAEASREQLGVFPVHTSDAAGERILEFEAR